MWPCWWNCGPVHCRKYTSLYNELSVLTLHVSRHLQANDIRDVSSNVMVTLYVQYNKLTILVYFNFLRARNPVDDVMERGKDCHSLSISYKCWSVTGVSSFIMSVPFSHRIVLHSSHLASFLALLLCLRGWPPWCCPKPAENLYRTLCIKVLGTKEIKRWKKGKMKTPRCSRPQFRRQLLILAYYQVNVSRYTINVGM